MGKAAKSKKQRRAAREAARAAMIAQRRGMDDNVNKFEAMIRNSFGFAIKTGSRTEKVFLATRKLLDLVTSPTEDDPTWSQEEGDKNIRELAWWNVWLPKLLKAAEHPDFTQLKSHIKWLVTTDGVFSQTLPSSPNQKSDLLFELVVAVALLPHINNLRMETGNDTANPDLLFDFEGVRWGIACKALYSERPETLRDHVLKGAQQIQASGATRGFVCVSLRNLVDQKLFMVNEGGMLHGRSVAAGYEPDINQEVLRLESELVGPVLPHILEALKSYSKVSKGFESVWSIVARTGTPEWPRYTYRAWTGGHGNVGCKLVALLNQGLQGES